MTHRTYIIAEAGVNHNGSIYLAKQLVDAAKDSDADAIKFQTFKTENLVTKTAKQAEYQSKNIGETTSQFDMLKKLELSYMEFKEIQEYCDLKGIEFLSTPFDLESVDYLINQLKLQQMKVPSGEITNAPYLYKIASYGIKVILSTGMATLEEIHHALAFLAYGFANKKDITFSNVINFYQTDEAKSLLQDKVTILHCTSEYPAPFAELNLNALGHLKEVFSLEVGYSDHSEGILAPIAAVAKGAKIIEKHFTLDKELPGPDHKASLNPMELKEMIKAIRTIELALGNGIKAPTATEKKNKDVVRKSLVAAKPIKTGELFSLDNLTVKRPGIGIEPYYYWDYIGGIAKRDYEQDEVIQ